VAKTTSQVFNSPKWVAAAMLDAKIYTTRTSPLLAQFRFYMFRQDSLGEKLILEEFNIYLKIRAVEKAVICQNHPGVKMQVPPLPCIHQVRILGRTCRI
jgi:hypothetical protein